MPIAKDYKVNAVMKSGMGYRTVNAVGSDRRIEDVIIDALDGLGVKPDEMFQITVETLRKPRKEVNDER